MPTTTDGEIIAPTLEQWLLGVINDSPDAPSELNSALFELAPRSVAEQMVGRAITDEEFTEWLAENANDPQYLRLLQEQMALATAKVSGVGINALALIINWSVETNAWRTDPTGWDTLQRYIEHLMSELPDDSPVQASYLSAYAEKLIPYCKSQNIAVPPAWHRGTREKLRLVIDAFRSTIHQAEQNLLQPEEVQALNTQLAHAFEGLASPAMTVNSFKKDLVDMGARLERIVEAKGKEELISDSITRLVIECRPNESLAIKRAIGKLVEWK